MSSLSKFSSWDTEVETAKVQKQNLKDLLLKYRCVNFESEIIYRNNFNKLDSLDRNYESCQKYALSSSSSCKNPKKEA